VFEAVKTRVGQFERRVLGDVTPLRSVAAAPAQPRRMCVDHATKSNHRRLIVTLMVESLDTNPPSPPSSRP